MDITVDIVVKTDPANDNDKRATLLDLHRAAARVEEAIELSFHNWDYVTVRTSLRTPDDVIPAPPDDDEE